MLCHVLCHPVITMSSYVGRFLREYPVPNPWMMCNGVSQHGYGFQPTWQVPCRVESEFISNPRLQWRLVFEILIHLWKCSKGGCLKNHPCVGIVTAERILVPIGMLINVFADKWVWVSSKFCFHVQHDTFMKLSVVKQWQVKIPQPILCKSDDLTGVIR